MVFYALAALMILFTALFIWAGVWIWRELIASNERHAETLKRMEKRMGKFKW